MRSGEGGGKREEWDLWAGGGGEEGKVRHEGEEGKVRHEGEEGRRKEGHGEKREVLSSQCCTSLLWGMASEGKEMHQL